MSDIRELYARRIEAAALALGRGDRSEAERLYTEALTMGEENFGASSPELAVPLNELSRLYVRLSAHARAEPLLARLLEIRRATGENHPDVATVLAALAVARRGLGDHASAETLYRQALKIREAVHAPDHMAVVVTLEQLADTCVALRKFSEATALIERALPVREKALGAGHQTVQALRDRLAGIAKLAVPPTPAPIMVPEPEAPPTNELVFIYEPEKPKRRMSVKRDITVTPPFSAAVAAASLFAVPGQAQAAPSAPAPAPTEVAVPSLVLLPPSYELESATVPRPEPARAPKENVPRRSTRIASSSPRFDAAPFSAKNKTARYGVAAGGLSVLAGGLFFANAHLSKGTTLESSRPEPQPSAPAVATPAAVPAASVVAPALLATARRDSAHRATMTPAPVAPSPKSQPEPEKVAAAPSLPAVLPSIGGIALPETKAINVDSVLRSSSARRDTDSDQILPARRLQSSTLADDRESPPVLIGSAPQPRFPDALRAQRMDGAVVVQFLVGVDGRVDASSMKVVSSPHALFTAAVRNVLPSFRFEPAHTADAKPRAEWVQYSIQFSAK